MKKIIKAILFISIIVFAVSFFQKDNFPDKKEILEKLYQDPLQTETNEISFEKEKGGIIYTINPLYDYELYGMVVSYHHSAGWWDYYHKKWNDFINIKDICVIFGDNLLSEVYKEMEFKSGSWTCYSEFKSGTPKEIWSKFKNSCVSNNHLLSAGEDINKIIMSAEKGDQIYLKGYLAEYSHTGGSFRRGSSATREDTGNGACETIYVSDFKILKKANPLWRFAFSFSKYSIIGCLIFLTIFFFKSPVYNRPAA